MLCPFSSPRRKPLTPKDDLRLARRLVPRRRRHETEAILEQYKLMVDGRETVNARRQAVHNFLIAANAALLAALCLFVKGATTSHELAVAAIVLGIVGFVLNLIWWRIALAYELISYAKVAVIRALELYLPARQFREENSLLTKGRYPGLMRLEIWFPKVFAFVHVLAVVAGSVLIALS